MEKKEPSYTLDENVHSGSVWRFFKKLKIKLPYDPAIPLLCVDPEKNHNSKRHMYPSVHCCTISNSQDTEAT